jgi:hypothetical protein
MNISTLDKPMRLRSVSVFDGPLWSFALERRLGSPTGVIDGCTALIKLMFARGLALRAGKQPFCFKMQNGQPKQRS